MTPEQFTYWLQGKLEGRKITDLGPSELHAIQDHLATVFHKVTPERMVYPTTTPHYEPQPTGPLGEKYQIIC